MHTGHVPVLSCNCSVLRTGKWRLVLPQVHFVCHDTACPFLYGYQACVSAAELDNILCILDRFWLNGKIAFWEGGDFEEESRDLLACSGGMMHQTCRRMANLQDTCWSI